MLDILSGQIENAFKKLEGKKAVDEENIVAAVKKLRKVLVNAGVPYKVAKQVTNEIKIKAIEKKILKSTMPLQLLEKVTHAAIVQLLGGEVASTHLVSHPAVILLLGLPGSGKTTFAGKLAKLIQSTDDKHVLLVNGDTTSNQLQDVAARAEVAFYAVPDDRKPVQMVKNALTYAKENSYDVVVIDTTSCLPTNEAMMTELNDLKKVVQPHETLLVVDATIRQNAVKDVVLFDKWIDVDGVALTKLEYDAYGGAMLSMHAVTSKVIKYASTGESMTAINVFSPTEMAHRLLGLNRVIRLVTSDPPMIDYKLMGVNRVNPFDYDDFLTCLQQPNAKDELPKLMNASSDKTENDAPKDKDENVLRAMVAIICAMTIEERRKPWLLKDSQRRKRIAQGSGTSLQQVTRLIKRFEQKRRALKKERRLRKKGNTDINPFE